MNSPTSNEIDSHNVYTDDQQRNQEEDTSIQLGNAEIKGEPSTFVINQENEKVKEQEKERQKILNQGSYRCFWIQYLFYYYYLFINYLFLY